MDKTVSGGNTFFAFLGEPPVRDVYTEQILLAARKLLARQGLKQTSLAEIAGAAGCSERTLYRRFADRDDLLRAVFLREIEDLTAKVEDRLEGVTDPAEKVVGAFMVLARTLREHGVLQRLLITDPETILPFATTGAAPLLVAAINWISTSYMEGAPLVGDPEQIAEILARLVISLTLTPSPTLHFETDRQAEDLARSLIVPLLFDPGRGPASQEDT